MNTSPESPPPAIEDHLICTVTRYGQMEDRDWKRTAERNARQDNYESLSLRWVIDQAEGVATLYGQPLPVDCVRAGFAPESFATAPLTLGEARAKRSGAGNDWKPRDLLVQMLRDIDSGAVEISELVVTFETPTGGGFWNATSSLTLALGLLAQAQIGLAAHNHG